MHKFLRAVGFSDIRKKDLEIILNDIVDRPDVMKATRDSEGCEFAELASEYAPGMGIKVCGTYEEDDQFHVEYYFPYLTGTSQTTQEPIEIQKHADRESYAGVCDEVNLGVTLIFYVQNIADYLSEKRVQEFVQIPGAVMAGLSCEGSIILPVLKREEKKQTRENASRKHNELVAEAREGNQEAMESLTLEEMDTYALISKRIMKEDVLSIVATYFMPYGIESDQYAILGEIVDLTLEENKWTSEQIYRMKLKCNELLFDVCINKKDLVGEPEIGRRFKGSVWMQGNICL